ncbi:diguanylate cyclase [Paraburkholderia sp. MMS20-SJTN17]|uniref:diguanylate cyclase n=1 Tax=Paraburkholderia translucens TaxID=2886945 RepID=A0ABS8KLD3_9BURK|nr:sensor domain-containing diguanylate cyclase [Paraburkholderia sp. MMS20-SJTN17]MCC8405542.1 diguanylate cyclase [Paraburkholderia sp. MMS20-SJTN17]
MRQLIHIWRRTFTVNLRESGSQLPHAPVHRLACDWRLPLVAMLLAGSLSFLICLGSGTLKAMWGEIAPIWLANGVLLAQAMVSKGSHRYCILLGGALGFFGANLYVGESLYVSTSFTGSDMVEVCVALLFVPNVATAAELIQPRPCIRFVAAAVLLAPLVSGVTAMSLLDGWASNHPFSSIANWIVSDALGMAIFAPAALVFFSGEILHLWRSPKRKRTAALLSLLAVVTAVVFGQSRYPLMYWILPPIALLAFEAELAAVLLGVLLTSVIAIAFTLNQTGPFWLFPYATTHDRILALQFLVLAALAIAFPVSVLQSQRSRLMNLLREREYRYRALAESSGEIVMQLSLERKIMYVSSRVEIVLGYGVRDLLDRSFSELVHPDDRAKVEAAASGAILEKTEAAANFRISRLDGEYLWVQGHVSALPDISGNAFSSLAFAIRDVHAKTLEDERRNAEQFELERLAYRDVLSGLYNRRHFDIELDRRISSSGSKTVSLLLIDIDNFKTYNDHYGHPAGDACLQRVAKTLGAAARSGDVAARYGGEEFAVILADCTEGEALEVAERIRANVEAAVIPHASSSFGVVTVSVGLAVADVGRGVAARELVGQADAMLYRAKRMGRNRVADRRGVSFEQLPML